MISRGSSKLFDKLAKKLSEKGSEDTLPLADRIEDIV